MQKINSAFKILFGLFLLLNLVGCEKLNFLNPKQTSKKPSTTLTAPSKEVKGTLIARVNNIPITLEELNQEIEAYNSLVPTDRPELKITTRDQKINYLKEEMVKRLLLYQYALDLGLDRKDNIKEALERTKQDLLVMELVRQEMDKVEVSSKEIEEAYNTYKEQFKEAEERQIREIMVPTEAEAKDILIQLLQGADFATLAKERSKAVSAKDGGDLGFITKGKKFSQFDNVAFSDTLEVGRYSNIFKGPDGYYIIKLEAKRGGKQKTLNEMWDDIKAGLTYLKQKERIDDLVNKLKNEAKLEFYETEIK